ncbi:uncharacterized protein LOC144785833 [Lissotriton helveticus]
MAPKRARATPGSPATKEEPGCLEELLEIVKTHGIDRALKWLSEDPGKDQQQSARYPKRQRKVPARYRGALPVGVSEAGNQLPLASDTSGGPVAGLEPVPPLVGQVSQSSINNTIVEVVGPNNGVIFKADLEDSKPIKVAVPLAAQEPPMASTGASQLQGATTVRDVPTSESSLQGPPAAGTSSTAGGGEVPGSTAAQVWAQPPAGTVPTSLAAGQRPLNSSPILFDTALSTPAPFSPITWHVPREMREKIHKGEFCNVFDLIYAWVGPGTGRMGKDGEHTHKAWVECSLRNWITGFSIYSAILTEKFPALAPQLFGYISLIHGVASDFQGTAWLKYDTKFRQKKAFCPEVAWDKWDINLWISELNTWSTKSPHSFPADRGERYKKAACWQYNEKECLRGAACKFKHLCSFCGNQGHPETKCFKKHGQPKNRLGPKGH